MKSRFGVPTTFNVVEFDVLTCPPTCVTLAIEEGSFAADSCIYDLDRTLEDGS